MYKVFFTQYAYNYKHKYIYRIQLQSFKLHIKPINTFLCGYNTTQIHDKTKLTKYLLDILSKKKVSIRHNSKLRTIKIASIERNFYFMQKCFIKHLHTYSSTNTIFFEP